MKKRIISKKLISCLAISTLVLGLFATTVINADEADAINEPEIQEVEETTEEQEIVEEETIEENKEVIDLETTSESEINKINRSNLARVDLTADAFPVSSKLLNDAIVSKYGALIDIDGNGTISVGEANAYTGSISLNYIEIGGTLDGIENFTNITSLSMHDTKMTGKIPESIGEMKLLKSINLNDNALNGELPESLATIPNLENVYLDLNSLEGEIPASYAKMPSIKYFSVSNNNLRGEVPAGLLSISTLYHFNIGCNPLITGGISSSTANTNITSLNYAFTGITSADLSNFDSLITLSVTKATNANLSSVTTFYVSGSKDIYSPQIRLTGLANAVTWDETTGYYVIAPSSSVIYKIRIPYIRENGTYGSVDASSVSLDLSSGGLMDNEGNLIIGATLGDIKDGVLVLENGGTVVTGGATYTFNEYTEVKEKEIITTGVVEVLNHSTENNSGSTTVEFGTTTTVSSPAGTDTTIKLDGLGGETILPQGSIVTDKDGDKVYISDEAVMDDEGNINSSGTYVTVSKDETTTTNSDGTITLPENSTVTVNDEETVYPRTIIFSPEDGNLQYIPVSELLNQDGTDLENGITQKEIDDAKTLVDGLTEGNLKGQLTEIVDTAQNILNAKEVVESLFTDGTHTDIPNDLTKNDIDKAQELINKVPDGTLKEALQKEIDKAKDILDSKNKVDNLFTDNTHTDILDNLTQPNIDNAQKAVDKLPSSDLKDELQKEIDKAQDMLDAKSKVDDLFTDGTHTDITDGLTQKDVDRVQDAVDKLPNGTLKDELQKEIDKAQDMLDAKEAVGDLLDKDGNLYSDITQKDIDKVQDLVNKLPDGGLKEELQAIIDEAQKQLDEKNKNNPSTAPTIQKPSVDSGSTSSTSNVKTADTTNISLYLGLLVISLGGIVLVKIRKIESK